MKYTAPVRRGFAWMLLQGLALNAEKFIARNQAGHLPRDQRMKADEAADIRAAVAWLQQEQDMSGLLNEGILQEVPVEFKAKMVEGKRLGLIVIKHKGDFSWTRTRTPKPSAPSSTRPCA